MIRSILYAKIFKNVIHKNVILTVFLSSSLDVLSSADDKTRSFPDSVSITPDKSWKGFKHYDNLNKLS